MKKAGCFQIAFGVESGSQERLNDMKKGITVEQVKKVFKMCHEIGIRPFACFMFNTPNETEEDVKKSIDLIEELKACWYNIAICTPLPGTDIYSYVKPKLTVDEYYKYITAYRVLNDPRFRMAKHNYDLTRLVKLLNRKYNNSMKRALNIFPLFINKEYTKQFIRSKKKSKYLKEIFHIFKILVKRNLRMG